jgi:hypothetical protein
MNDVFCMFYDDELDQDVPLEPANIAEAVAVFTKFNWKNEQAESVMKLLIYRSTDVGDPSLFISCLEEGMWCLDISLYQRRRYLGPFFKKNIHRSFMDLSQHESETLIRLFCTAPVPELTTFLEKNESGPVVSY